jgi:uncharacterized protein YndB with AHSA1/START domain/uncharacterized protein YciI
MTVAPIRREIVVPATPERAFALFTAHLGRWWPLRKFSVYGADAIVAFEGDRVVERSGGEENVWAEVVEWDPPTRLRLSWHPGRDDTHATDVQVSFAGHDGGTLVTLVHSGWERAEDPAGAAEEYRNGWPGVLGAFEAWAGGTVVGATWFVLLNRPGPAVEQGSSIFQHPGFAEHVAFLERLHGRGLLVAAGPLPDEPGSGMTVVRVPEGDDADMHDLATRDDLSVVQGVLEVEVRPWDVRFTGQDG